MHASSTAFTAQAQAPAADSNSVECSLRLAAKERIYQFSCTGGYATAAAGSPTVLRLVGGPERSAGVNWSADNCGLLPGSCAIAICGSHRSRPGNNSAALTWHLELSGLQLKSLGVDSNQTGSWKYRYYYMYEDRVQALSGLVCLAGNITAMLPVSACSLHCCASSSTVTGSTLYGRPMNGLLAAACITDLAESAWGSTFQTLLFAVARCPVHFRGGQQPIALLAADPVA